MGFYEDHVLTHVINIVLNTPANRAVRTRVCAGLEGEVLEIGFGSGYNLPHLPSTVTALKAVDPSGASLALARRRIAAATAPVEVIGLDGERLPLPDASVDAVLCTWSLCTIPDPVAAVREARRVLRPGGRYHFVEHGRSPDERVRRWQDRLTPVQRRLVANCHLNRDITGIIEAGGFRIDELRQYYAPMAPKFFGHFSEGVAVAS